MSTLFNNKNEEPNDAILAAALGESKEWLDAISLFIEKEFGDFHSEWKFYGEKQGWSMKLFHKKRNVLFVAPKNGHFRVAFAFGEKAYKDVLQSDLPDTIKQELISAKVYVEGRALRLEIRSKEDFGTVCQLIRIKLKKL